MPAGPHGDPVAAQRVEHPLVRAADACRDGPAGKSLVYVQLDEHLAGEFGQVLLAAGRPSGDAGPLQRADDPSG